MSAKTRSTLINVAKVAVAVAIITYLVRSGIFDPKSLWALMTLPNIALALFLVGLSTVLAAWRWILLLNSRGFQLSFLNGISLYLIGIFFNYVLPGSVGGDFVRAYYLVADHPKQKLDAILSVVIDRVLGLYSYFLLTIVAVAFDYDLVMSQPKIRTVALLAFAICIAMTAFFLVVFSNRLSRLTGLTFFEGRIPPVQKIAMAFRRFGENPRMIAASVGVSVLAQLVAMLFFYQIAVASGESAVTWRAILFAMPMGFLVTALPIGFAGIGVGQVAFLYLFKIYLQSDTQFGATVITAFQLAQAAWAIVGAACYLRWRGPKDLQQAVAEMA